MTTLPSVANVTSDAATKAQMKSYFTDWLNFIAQQVGAAAELNFTLATDAITPTCGTIRVTSEGAATSDNLATISTANLPDGSLLLISPASGHTITAKHSAAGTAGSIYLAGGADFVMGNINTYLLLRRFGIYWREVGRMGYGVTTPATDTTPGIAEFATAAEILTGTDATRMAGPVGLLGSLGASGWWNVAKNLGNTINLNTLLTNGLFYVGATGQTNGPGLSNIMLLVASISTSIFQLAMSTSGGAIAYRKSVDTGSTWSAWIYPSDPASVTARTAQNSFTPVAVTSSAGSLAIDLAIHEEATITLSENTTVAAPSNRAAGRYLTLVITGASTYTLAWNAVYKAASGLSLPSAPAAGKYIVVKFRCMDATNLQLVSVTTGL